MQKDTLGKLIGLELTSVEFVRDYVQLRFDGTVLSAYTLPKIYVGNKKVASPSSVGYADMLIANIGRVVKRADDSGGTEIVIEFTNEQALKISLLDKDRRADEAALMSTEEGGFWSW